MVQVTGEGGPLGFLKQIREFQSLTGNFEIGSVEVREATEHPAMHRMAPPTTKSDPVQNVKVQRLHNPTFTDETIEDVGSKRGSQSLQQLFICARSHAEYPPPLAHVTYS